MAKKIKLSKEDDVFKGSGKDETIIGKAGDDAISGGGGNDTIKGGAGNDVLKGGAGDDTLNGGAGNDILFGGAGDDRIIVGKGNDTVNGGEGDDTVVLAGNLADATITKDGDGRYVITTVNGTATVSNVELFTFADGTVDTAALDDIVNGNTGENLNLTVNQDNLVGGSDNDIFTAAAAQDGGGNLINTLQNVDVLDGGDGTDTLKATLSEGITVAATIKNIENIEARFANAAAVLGLANATGVTDLTIADSTTTAQVTGLGAIANISVANHNAGVKLDGSTATTLNLNLDTFGKATGSQTVDLGSVTAAKATTLNLAVNNAYAIIDSTGADAVTTLAVAATGANSVSLVDSGDDVTSATVTGAGSVDFTATAFTGALKSFDGSANTGGIKADIQSTVAVAVSTGTGNDVIDMDTAVAVDSTVTLGDGDDALYAGALLGNFKSADGGNGTDIINITDGSTLTSTTAAKISGFEVLDVSGGGTGGNAYDVSLEGFTKVQIDESINGALTGALSITNAGANFAFDVISAAKSNADFALGQAQTIALKDATGTSDAVTINVALNDGNNDAAADGNVTFTTSTTIAGVETITVNSSIATPDTDLKGSDYNSTFTNLIADSVKTLNLTGNTDIVFTALTNAGNTLTKVDASTSTGDITLNLSALTSTVAYSGSAGVDTYAATNGGSIYGASGNDQITLVAVGTNADTLIYKAATDTALVDANKDSKIDVQVMETVFNFLTTSSAAANQHDVIDVTSFGFTGYAGSAVNKGALADAVDAGNFATSIADFFADAAGDRGVAYGTNGGDTFVFIDANKDGNFTSADDIVVKLDTVADVTVSDFAF